MWDIKQASQAGRKVGCRWNIIKKVAFTPVQKFIQRASLNKLMHS